MLLCLLSACSPGDGTPAIADAQPLRWGPVATVTDEGAHAVVSTAASPQDDGLRALVTMRITDFSPTQFSHHVRAFVSRDSSASWQDSSLPAVPGATHSAGASVAFSPSGVLYVAHSVRSAEERGSQVAVHRSRDGGRTWGLTTVIPVRVADTPKISIDQDGVVYVSIYDRADDPLLGRPASDRGWAIVVATSRDEAESFELTSVTFDNDLTLGVYNVVTFSDGNPWLAFSQFSSDPATRTSNLYGLGSFPLSISVADVDHVAELGRRIPRMANAAVDGGSRFVDRLYVAYSVGPSDSLVTAVVRSDDRGRSWFAPTTLSAPSGGHHSRLPRVAVHESGVVGIAWLQTEAESDRCWRIHFAYSVDGGASFSEPNPVSANPSCPDTIDELGTNQGLRRFYGFGGDYMGLAATEGGFQIAWTDLSAGRLEIRTRQVETG
ncbi:MAG: hypothetical protein GKS06_20180 [Acidobacteria bacterium]|nr:hypothetical protein [Acidobacteriota bacterium]